MTGPNQPAPATRRVRVPARVLEFITDSQDWSDWFRKDPSPAREPLFGVISDATPRKDRSIHIDVTEEMAADLRQWADWMEYFASNGASERFGENASALADLNAARAVMRAVDRLNWKD